MTAKQETPTVVLRRIEAEIGLARNITKALKRTYAPYQRESMMHNLHMLLAQASQDALKLQQVYNKETVHE
jgi:hypothetical protein